jgi:transcription factor SPN1
MTKREKMEALKKKARAAAGLSDEKPKGGNKEASNHDKGYDSQNSYDSGTGYMRTKEDDDFIDVEGEDEDVVRDYYAEQNFDDERPDEEEEEAGIPKKGKKGKGSNKKRGPDALSAEDEKDENNPMMAAVNRMKKKKKTVQSFEEKKEVAEEFVSRMEYSADEDDLAIKEKRPGLKKLQMLPQAVEMMTNREMIRPLIESDVLSAVKRWIQPLPNGSLGNVTVRNKMIDVVSKMGTGEEHGIDTDDLKKSGFGKLVMTLYMHKKETPAMKKQLKKLIEEWSRTIFGKSGNMKDLASAQQSRRRNTGLTGFARSQAAAAHDGEKMSSASSSRQSNMEGDIGVMMSKGVKQARDLGKNRVRIPYSKGFQYSIRPSDVTGDVTDKKTRISTVRDGRESLHKTMLEKKRPVNKNARSANISIEGRATK